VPRFATTVEIARPPQDVFAFLTDLSKLPQWQSSLAGAHAEEPMRVGTRIRERRKFMGRELNTQVEVTTYDPPRRFDLESRGGPLSFEIRHRLQPAGDGTRLDVEVEFKLGAMAGIAARPLLKPAEREFRSDFERLKRVLEG
jgi:carbon monoxide dehydrogenase subunit G